MDFSYTYSHNFLHEMHSLVKFVLLLLYIPLIYMYSHPLYLLILSVNLGTLAYCGGVLKKTLRVTRFTLIAGLIIAAINILIRKDGTTGLLSVSIPVGKLVLENPRSIGIYISLETVIFSAIMVYQLFLVMVVFSLVNFLIDPDKLLKALVKLRLPPQILYMVVLSIRFIPVLMEDLNRIQDLQRARGLDLDKGSFLTRIKNKISLLLPLLTNSLERSIQISEALESRAFGFTSKRTYYKFERIRSSEILISVINGAMIIAAVIFNAVLRSGEMVIFPTIAWPPVGLWDGVTALILLGSTGSIILLAKWRWTK